MSRSQPQADQAAVCVMIAARNAQSTIAAAVASAVSEPEVAEVVVVDDASDDRTFEAASAAASGSPKLSVIRFETNRGPAAARNVAIATSASPLLCVLDADDYFLKGRLGRLLATAGRWDFLADDIILTRKVSPIGLHDLVPGAGGAWRIGLEEFVRGNIGRPGERRRELGFLKPLMRRSFLEAHRLRYKENLRLGEDFALYVEALAVGAQFVLTRPCGYVAVERSDSLSGRHRTSDLAAIVAFDDTVMARAKKLCPKERAALQAHRNATQWKWQHRHVLDTRREHGYVAALRELAGVPGAWPHILAETMRAKIGRLSELQSAEPPAGARLLIG